LDPKAWGNLANVDNMLGRYEQALEPAKRALALNAGSEQPYVVLARTYLRLGRADLARSIGAQAIKHGVDGDAIHAVLLAAAFMQHDEAGMQREVTWGRAKAADRILLVVEGQIAYAQGKIREGDKMFDQSAELSREKGLPDFARFYRARLLNDLGLQDRARKLLATATDADDDDDDLIFTLAEVGDRARAAGLLAKQVRNHPEGTLITFDFEPEVRAALLLRQGQAPEAVAVLQKAIPYQSRTFDIPYLLGRSYLAAGDGVQAKTAFQLILDNPGWYPESPLYALARLGQARALRRQHDLAGARQAYQALFVSWKGADRDLPALKAAQYEYAHLGPP
jgi:tetratricopeptide (TPR) repeat protein